MSESNNREDFRKEMDAYIRDHAPVSCDDMVRAMRSRGLPCHPNTVRSYLRESGLHVRNVGGRWLWGVWNDEQNEQNESPKIESNRPQNERNDRKAQERQETNERMTQERDALWDAVQKSVSLKNEIKSAQERLLMEIAGLIQATYGQSPVASVPSPRESETKSEVD